MSADLITLREKIARLEAGGPANAAGRHAAVALGLPAVEATLPDGGLRRGAVHELLFPHAADGAATALALRVLGRLAGPGARFLWCGCRDDLFAPGFAPWLDPGQVLFARAETMTDVLWCVEEALRCPDLTAVVADAATVDFALSRRLSLAAAESGGLLLMLQPHRPPLPASAAHTRWRVAAAPHGCWRLDLLRVKGGRPGSWVADPATGDVQAPPSRDALPPMRAA